MGNSFWDFHNVLKSLHEKAKSEEKYIRENEADWLLGVFPGSREESDAMISKYGKEVTNGK